MAARIVALTGNEVRSLETLIRAEIKLKKHDLQPGARQALANILELLTETTVGAK